MKIREVRDPRWQRGSSHRLATFSASDIGDFREAECSRSGAKANRLKHCDQDQAVSTFSDG
jgi:hypothetical protein